MNTLPRWVTPDGCTENFPSAMAAHIAYIRCLPLVTPEFGALQCAFQKFFLEGRVFQLLGPVRDPSRDVEEYTGPFEPEVEAQLLHWLLHYLTQFFSFFHWAALSIPLCHYRLVHGLKVKFSNPESVKKCPQFTCQLVSRVGHWLNDSAIGVPFLIKLFDVANEAKQELGRSPSAKELHVIVATTAALFAQSFGDVDEEAAPDELHHHTENGQLR